MKVVKSRCSRSEFEGKEKDEEPIDQSDDSIIKQINLPEKKVFQPRMNTVKISNQPSSSGSQQKNELEGKAKGDMRLSFFNQENQFKYETLEDKMSKFIQEINEQFDDALKIGEKPEEMDLFSFFLTKANDLNDEFITELFFYLVNEKEFLSKEIIKDENELIRFQIIHIKLLETFHENTLREVLSFLFLREVTQNFQKLNRLSFEAIFKAFFEQLLLREMKTLCPRKCYLLACIYFKISELHKFSCFLKGIKDTRMKLIFLRVFLEHN